MQVVQRETQGHGAKTPLEKIGEMVTPREVEGRSGRETVRLKMSRWANRRQMIY